MKEATQRGLQASLPERMHTAAVMLSDVLRTKDAQEGVKAFAEKRAPVYRGE